MTVDLLEITHLPTPAEAEAIADEIARQLAGAFDDDGRPTAETSVHLPRSRWAALLALLREKERTGPAAGFAAGIVHAASLAQIAAVTLEARPDADHLRQRSAIEALRGLAEGLKASTSTTLAEQR